MLKEKKDLEAKTLLEKHEKEAIALAKQEEENKKVL